MPASRWRHLAPSGAGPRSASSAGLLTRAAGPTHLPGGSSPAAAAVCRRARACAGAVTTSDAQVLGLRGRLHHAAQHLLQRVGLRRPRRGAAHQVAHQVEGHLRPVEGGAGPGPAHP